MRLTTFLFALCVISARSATIPENVTGDIEKKIEDVVKEVLEKDSQPVKNQANEQELDQSNSINDVNNNLKKADISDIPVKVVVEDVQQSLRTSEEKISNDEAALIEEIKREVIDLNNPGIAQRQEHETQNPEHHEEENLSFLIKQNIIETRAKFNNEVQNLQNKIKGLITTDQEKNEIQEQLKRLQDSFQTQIDNLSETVKKHIPEDKYDPPALRTLPDADKVDVKATKIEGKQESSTASPTTQPSANPIAQYFQQLQQSISNNIAQMQEQMQSYFNNNNQQAPQSPQAAGAQSDEGATTSRPSLWQSITNIFNPANNQASQQSDTPASQPAAPNRPIVQAIQSNIQSNPIYQSVASVFNPNRPATNKPDAASAAQASQPAPEKPESPSSEGTNAVPPKPEAQKQKPESVQYSQSGPIKQMLIEKNPIVQGIAGAVQRIQQSITNPDKPRDVVKRDEQDALNDDKKRKHSDHSHSEHNNDVVDCHGVKVEQDPNENKPEQSIPVDPLKEKDPTKKEQSPQDAPKKTE